MRELFIEIFASLRKNKLRTVLTGFSVAWGIFMLVILLGSGNGLKNGVLSNFGDYAINSIDLFGGYTSKPYAGYDKYRRIALRNEDLEIIAREFPEVETVAANTWLDSKTASYGDRFMKLGLRGSLPQTARLEGIHLASGRFINELDVERYRKSIVIDEALKQLLFRDADPLGQQIRVGDSTSRAVFTVVGVEQGTANRTNSYAYIPLTTAQLMYKGNDPEVSNALFTIEGLDTDEAMQEFEDRLLARLAAEHRFDPTDRSAVWIGNNLENFKDFMLVFNGIDLFIWIIGLGTLLAGIVGVSNIMLVTVTERTFEFGLRKALGARPSSIIRLILTESVLVTALFGYLGMVLGVGVMEVVNYVIEQMPRSDDGFGGTMFLNPTLDLSVAVSATIVLVVAGLIAGYVPAHRAAQLKTIDALRHNR